MNILVDIRRYIEVNNMFNISETFILQIVRQKNEKKKTSYGMSRPRAATFVATRIGVRPCLNDFSASSRWPCDRSPWILLTAYWLLQRNSSSISAPRLVSTKTKVNVSEQQRKSMKKKQITKNWAELPDWIFSRSRRNERFSASSTQTIFWVIFCEVEPTRPIVKKT